MPVEIIITVIIVGFAAYLLFKNLKKNASGKCNCGNCLSKCPKYKADDRKNKNPTS